MEKEKRAKRAPRNKLTAHVTQDIKRRQLKPITEKIRRERINNSLHELKVLVLNAMNKDVQQYAKMEKADILDMAVKYIKCTQTAKQEFRDGSLGPTQGNHRTALVTSPDEFPINTNITSRRQSNTPDIESENNWSGMTGLVQPEVSKPYQAYATMTTQKNHASSAILADYALIPSSFSNDGLLSSAANTQGRNSPTHNDMSSRFLSPLGKSGDTSNIRSPLAENKKRNAFTTKTTDSKKLFSTSFEKRKSAGTENQNHVRLPGMECFVKDTYMAEHFKENQIYNNYVFMNHAREIEIDQFDSGQFSLPLWRPW